MADELHIAAVHVVVEAVVVRKLFVEIRFVLWPSYQTGASWRTALQGFVCVSSMIP
jgi:hypothetical protein